MYDISGIRRDSRTKLALVLREAKPAVSVEQVATCLRIPKVEAAKRLARWARQGWLSRIRRGLYVAVPLESRMGDVLLEDPWVIVERLYSPCYIGGWSAAEQWELTRETFSSVVVMTTRKVRDRRPVIKGAHFVVRTILPEALFGTISIWRGNVKVSVSDPSRTILDLLDDPYFGGGLRSMVEGFCAYLDSQARDLPLLISYAEQLANGAIFKRLGYLLERFAPREEATIEACRARLSQGNAKLDPALPAERLITNWRLWVPANWARDE
jgi:predicted transcriptional regulator of viral defense system